MVGPFTGRQFDLPFPAYHCIRYLSCIEKCMYSRMEINFFGNLGTVNLFFEKGYPVSISMKYSNHVLFLVFNIDSKNESPKRFLNEQKGYLLVSLNILHMNNF